MWAPGYHRKGSISGTPSTFGAPFDTARNGRKIRPLWRLRIRSDGDANRGDDTLAELICTALHERAFHPFQLGRPGLIDGRDGEMPLFEPGRTTVLGQFGPHNRFPRLEHGLHSTGRRESHGLDDTLQTSADLSRSPTARAG